MARDWTDLSTYNTRELMALRQRAFDCGGRGFDPCGGYGDTYITMEQIKDELSRREHIPNKKEARKIRQEKNRR